MNVNRFEWISGSVASPSVTNLGFNRPVTITTNQKPQGHDDTADTVENISVDIDVLANDTDVEGSPLAVTNVGNGANGTTSINADGTVNYTPNAGFAGIDVFTYTVSEYLPQSCSDILNEDASENLGLIRSRDMGITWEFFAPDFRTREVSTFDISADGQTIYVNEGGIYFGWASRDAGETWSQGPILQVNGPVAMSPADPNLVIFGSPGDIRRSTNGLSSMNVVFTSGITIREIVFSPSHPNIVYTEADGYFLYRSDDAGLTWRLLVHGRDEVLNAQP